MYCRNCGKETVPGGEYCMSCGARPLAGTTYCPACAGATTPLSENCVKCGTRLTRTSPDAAAPVRRSKSKVASILLAVFLGFWTWLYTYKKDGWKFWTGLGINLLGTLIGIVVIVVNLARDIGNSNYSDEFATAFMLQWILFTLAATLIGSAIWIWGIVDTAIKREEWSSNYPNPDRTETKILNPNTRS